jgi:hypothetical protein
VQGVLARGVLLFQAYVETSREKVLLATPGAGGLCAAPRVGSWPPLETLGCTLLFLIVF